MKKTSKILFLVGGIISVLLIILFGLFAVSGFVCGGLAFDIASGGNPGQEIVDVFAKMVAETKLTLQEIGSTFMVFGGVFIVLVVFNIACLILSFIDRARENPGLGLLIPSSVIHLFAGNVVSLAGGIVGIVYWSTKGRKEE